jgi:hypothetical protein
MLDTTSPVLRHLLIGAAAAAIALSLGACSGGPAPVAPYARVSAATLAVDAQIPMPDDTILTISGASAMNNGGRLELDVPTIEQLGLVRYREHDPWLETDIDFTGVLVSELLDRIGVPAAATTLRIVALDDYQVDIAIADVRRWPVMLATQSDGKPMSIVDKGPTRIVFPHTAFKDIDTLKYKDLWIWQIKTIEVR